jgi:hypothetical protein
MLESKPQAANNKQYILGRALMEVAELKTKIGDLEARVDKIRDWL